ncbi:hypothetical protein ACFONN_17320 [Dyella humi]|uniref:IS6 family transposase n=1 Tax=Dyella humi TaxID=1770547 RepID=A0ABW8IDA8_9GAMM
MKPRDHQAKGDKKVRGSNRRGMTVERDIEVDHSTMRRWLREMLLMLEKAFRYYNQTVDRARWVDDETMIRIVDEWKSLYSVANKGARVGPCSRHQVSDAKSGVQHVDQDSTNW